MLTNRIELRAYEEYQLPAALTNCLKGDEMADPNIYTEQELAQEEWRAVPGFENYQASNLGRIKSLKANIIMRVYVGDRGYMRIFLYGNGKKNLKRVHRVIMETFVGPSDMYVNHKNSVTTDNRLDNLEYVTHRDNVLHGSKKGGYTGVHYCNTKPGWCAQTRINNKYKWIGLYKTEEDAARAYKQTLKDNNITAKYARLIED